MDEGVPVRDHRPGLARLIAEHRQPGDIDVHLRRLGVEFPQSVAGRLDGHRQLALEVDKGHLPVGELAQDGAVVQRIGP
jgi:hypothetical protein